MAAENPNLNGSKKASIAADLSRLVASREWDKAIELLTPETEEVESKVEPRRAELIRAIENRDWKALDELTGMSPEEAERILRDEPIIDVADFNRLLEELDRREEGKNAAQSFAVPKPCVQTPDDSAASA